MQDFKGNFSIWHVDPGFFLKAIPHPPYFRKVEQLIFRFHKFTNILFFELASAEMSFFRSKNAGIFADTPRWDYHYHPSYPILPANREIPPDSVLPVQLNPILQELFHASSRVFPSHLQRTLYHPPEIIYINFGGDWHFSWSLPNKRKGFPVIHVRKWALNDIEKTFFHFPVQGETANE